MIPSISLFGHLAVGARPGRDPPRRSRAACSARHGDPRNAKTLRLTLGLAVAVLSGRHPGQDPFAGRNPEAAAGDVRPIHDPGLFAIRSDLFLVVAAAVISDF
jgi:hypothetical protein